MSSLNDKLPAAIIMLFALALSGELITEWQFSPYDAGGHVAFVIWVCIGWVLFQRDRGPVLMLLVSSAILLLAGIITNLDVLVHASVLAASLQFVRARPSAVIFLVAGVLWTPAFSYLLANLSLEADCVLMIRTAMSTSALIVVLIFEGIVNTSTPFILRRGATRG